MLAAGIFVVFSELQLRRQVANNNDRVLQLAELGLGPYGNPDLRRRAQLLINYLTLHENEDPELVELLEKALRLAQLAPERTYYPATSTPQSDFRRPCLRF